MPTDEDRALHDHLAAIRATCTALADPASGFEQNEATGIAAYTAHPARSIMLIAEMIALRLNRRDQLLGDDDPSRGFPRAALEARLTLRRSTTRRDATRDCLDFLESRITDGNRDPAAVHALVEALGAFGFMRLAHINNLVGQLLVDVDPMHDSLTALMAAEALADEMEWLNWDDEA